MARHCRTVVTRKTDGFIIQCMRTDASSISKLLIEETMRDTVKGQLINVQESNISQPNRAEIR